MESKTYRQVINRAALLCSRSEKCKADLVPLLEKWGLSAEEIEKAIQYLIKERFLDEERYAKNFVHDKFHLNKWGKYKITYLLRMKQIPEDIISTSLETISEEEYERDIRYLLGKKAKLIKGASIRERKSKLISFAQGKGFEMDIAFRIADQIFSAEGEDSE